MKVLQINTVCGYGSTGRNAIELAQALMEQGHECYIAYGQGTTTYKNSFKIGSKLENHLHNACSRLFGKQGYYSKNGTIKLVRYIEQLKPDVIHLNNLHGNYLNLEILFEYLEKAEIPVVWTLHDCWAFTGKCAHYTAIGCYKWQTKCNHCPQLKTYPPSLFLDYSEKMFSDKKRWFTSVKNMTIVTVSQWLASEVRQSFLAKYPIVPIYNWVDYDVFRPLYEKSIIKKYNLEDKFVVLGVSSHWFNEKGLDVFIDMSRRIDEKTVIVLVGNMGRHILPKNIISIPQTTSVRDLSLWYSLADVFVNPSREETFGKVTAEAMSCGTPVVVYDSTASPEIVGKGCGEIVVSGNIDGLLAAIAVIKDKGKSYYAHYCTSWVKKYFDKKSRTDDYINVYKNVSLKILNK